jgi:Tfp pilus assembly protein PilO
MRFFNTRPSDQQRIAILVPIIALALSLFVVYPKWQEYRELIPKLEQQRKDLAALRAAPLPSQLPGIAAVAALPSEPPEFMGQVNYLAAAANCKVTGFDLKPPTGTVDAGPVQAIKSQIMLVARYADIRAFVSQVARSPRLLALSDLNVAPVIRAKNDGFPADALQATVEIERYVMPPEKK